MIEVSAISSFAAVFFAERKHDGKGGYSDSCFDNANDRAVNEIKNTVVDLLRTKGYFVVGWDPLNEVVDGKSVRHWLIDDPED